MKIGIGLPSTIPGVDGKTVVEWARRSEERGFTTLGVIDRIVYPNYEPLTTLAAAAAVTERIRLTTSVLLAPLRANVPLFAKQVATVDRLSGGRLTLGMGVGGREDDFEACGVNPRTRGRRMDEMLDEMKRIWAGEERGFAGGVGPRPASDGRPEILMGGFADAVVRRVAEHADGWIGTGAPDQSREFIQRANEAWSDAGREGSPRYAQLSYFALGPNARENADSYLHDYYGFAPEVADLVARSAAVNEEMIRQYIAAYEDAGAEEIIFFPSSTDLEQVDLLASAALD